MKLLFVWPAHEFSTYDVATGLRAGLLAEGCELADYRLYQRCKLMSAGVGVLTPTDMRPDSTIIALHASEAIPYKALAEGCDWAFVISGMGLHPNALWALRRMGVRVACWFTEAPYATKDDEELEIAKQVDIAFVNERTSVKDFQAVLDRNTGGEALYLPHAYNPDTHGPGEPEEGLTSDVLMVGTGWVERQMLLEGIDWTGINLVLGGMWTGIREPSFLASSLQFPCMDNKDAVRLYHGCKAAINPHRYHETAESTNPRTYELAACGAFQITDYRPEVAELFGDSVPTYHAGVPWQLETILRRYLDNDEERQRMADEARRRVRPHTFQARARTVLDTIAAFEHERKVVRLTA